MWGIGNDLRCMILSVKFKISYWSDKPRKLLRLKVENTKVKVANGTIHLFFVQMGCKIVTNGVFVSLHCVNGLDGNREHQGERKGCRD